MRRRRGSAAADDAAVIESSWREPERFAVLFDRHAPHIYRYLARRAGRQVADDLVAETFLALSPSGTGMTSATRMPGPGCTGSPPTWSASIAGTRPANTGSGGPPQPSLRFLVTPNGWLPMSRPRRCARCWPRRWPRCRPVTGCAAAHHLEQLTYQA